MLQQYSGNHPAYPKEKYSGNGHSWKDYGHYSFQAKSLSDKAAELTNRPTAKTLLESVKDASKAHELAAQAHYIAGNHPDANHIAQGMHDQEFMYHSKMSRGLNSLAKSSVDKS